MNFQVNSISTAEQKTTDQITYQNRKPHNFMTKFLDGYLKFLIDSHEIEYNPNQFCEKKWEVQKARRSDKSENVKADTALAHEQILFVKACTHECTAYRSLFSWNNRSS